MIKKKSKKGKLELDLTGPEGNAYVLMGYAKQFSRELGLDHSDILKQMTSGDYEHLVSVFDKYFGNYVTLYR